MKRVIMKNQDFIDYAVETIKDLSSLDKQDIFRQSEVADFRISVLEKTAELTENNFYFLGGDDHTPGSYPLAVAINRILKDNPEEQQNEGYFRCFTLNDGVLMFVGSSGLERIFKKIQPELVPAYATLELVFTELSGDTEFKTTELGAALLNLVNENDFWSNIYETFLKEEEIRDKNLVTQAFNFKSFVDSKWGILDLEKFAKLDEGSVKEFNSLDPTHKVETLCLLAHAKSSQKNPYVITDEEAFKSIDVSNLQGFTHMDAFSIMEMVSRISLSRNENESSELFRQVEPAEKYLSYLRIDSKEYVKFLTEPFSWFDNSEHEDTADILRRRTMDLAPNLNIKLLAFLSKDVIVTDDFKTGSNLQKIQWLTNVYNTGKAVDTESALVYKQLSKTGKIMLVRQDGDASKYYATMLKLSHTV